MTSPPSSSNNNAANTASTTTASSTTEGSGGGLTRSSPLVTVANVHGSGIIRPATTNTSTSLTAAGNDHPLANLDGSNSADTSIDDAPTIATPPVTAAATIATVPAAAAVVQPTVATIVAPPPQPAPPRPTTTSTPAKSLDALADQFLCAPSYRTSVLQLKPLLHPPPIVPNDNNPLLKIRCLASRRSWAQVLQVANDALRNNPASSYAPIYTLLINNTVQSSDPTIQKLQQDTLEILWLECHAWLKLGRYSNLGRQVDQWNFIYDDDNGGGGGDDTVIPGSIYILAAESLQYTDPSNTSTKCIDALYKLKDRFRDCNQHYWMVGLYQALANAHVRRKEWRLALDCLDKLLYTTNDDNNDNTNTSFLKELADWTCRKETSSNNNKKQLLVSAYKVEILTRQFKILLQVGALGGARTILDQLQLEADIILSIDSFDANNLGLNPHRMGAQVYINQGMMEFAAQDFEASLKYFKLAVDTLRQCQNHDDDLQQEQYSMYCPLAMDSPAQMLSTAITNMAMASLYSCRMKEAIRMMEGLVRESPTLYLSEQLAFNLATLYELGADTAVSSKNKRILQLVAKRFHLDDIGAESFRVT